jgi:SpoVK/Ycf46/Vps4 family AAA+-type ATPase
MLSTKMPYMETLIESLCKNPLCNHKTFIDDPTPVSKYCFNKLENINDLIILGKTYHCKKNREFNGINLRLLCNLVPPIFELEKMIGMKNVKEQIFDQIIYFLQGIHKTTKCGKCIDCAFGLPCTNNQNDMLHTVITGSPGVGKTELGKILGRIYKEIGILEKGHFRIVSRSDLIGEYLGQTAKKTQEVIDDCKDGVMFIDEAYSLGHRELRDSFSKECIDTLTHNLSERRNFLCIIAGYKQALNDCFFNFNEGLVRRFPFRYDLCDYTNQELLQIFEQKTKQNGLEIEKNKDIISLFKKEDYPNNGGDIETLLLNCKLLRSRRLIFEKNNVNILTWQDIQNGIKNFLQNKRSLK